MFGRRLYLGKYRIHHGLAGVLIVALAVVLLVTGFVLWNRMGGVMILLGVILIAHDWRDHPWPLIDREPSA